MCSAFHCREVKSGVKEKGDWERIFGACEFPKREREQLKGHKIVGGRKPVSSIYLKDKNLTKSLSDVANAHIQKVQQGLPKEVELNPSIDGAR